MTRADDFRLAVRRGARTVTPNAVIHRVSTETRTGPRFGVVVSKRVGGAVVRNRVRRRIQAICASSIDRVPADQLVVIRALPGSSDVSWDTLRAEIDDGLRRAVMAA